MESDLDTTWDDMAANFDCWGTPLRPPVDAVQSYGRLLARWAGNERRIRSALLFGVTPELALADWPVPMHLTAIDRSEPMLRRVWPGDLAGQRQGIVGDWMTHRPSQPPDLVLTDGAPVFYAHPEELFACARRLLADDGALLVRTFCAPSAREELGAVLADARAGQIENFHVLKWRTAMALQSEASSGVVQHTVWHTLTTAGLDFAALPQPGFSDRAVSTLRFYEGKRARLHFPTLEAYRCALRSVFAQVEVDVPTGLFGTQCPVFIATGRARSSVRSSHPVLTPDESP